ncbi:uncharacterized protein [Notamacropus eugenii]|uniref:uncharacterized protein isoform X2 n=1 Tax=Notamacropus eugenii TaxID=9315 RepID=UPI003B682B19
MRLWLLSLVAGITLGVAGTPLGKVSTGREQAEEEKERQDSLEPNSALNSLHIPENEKRNLSEALERIEEPDPYKKSLGTLNLPRTILLQLLNHTKAMKRNSEMDLTHWNLNGSITRDLCKGCCKEKEKPNLSRQSVVTSKRHSRERRPGQWTILGSMPLPLGNSSINMTEDLRRGWCSGCCKDGETLEVLERREGEEVREVPPAWVNMRGRKVERDEDNLYDSGEERQPLKEPKLRVILVKKRGTRRSIFGENMFVSRIVTIPRDVDLQQRTNSNLQSHQSPVAGQVDGPGCSG